MSSQKKDNYNRVETEIALSGMASLTLKLAAELCGISIPELIEYAVNLGVISINLLLSQSESIEKFIELIRENVNSVRLASEYGESVFHSVLLDLNKKLVN